MRWLYTFRPAILSRLAHKQHRQHHDSLRIPGHKRKFQKKNKRWTDILFINIGYRSICLFCWFISKLNRGKKIIKWKHSPQIRIHFWSVYLWFSRNLWRIVPNHVLWRRMVSRQHKLSNRPCLLYLSALSNSITKKKKKKILREVLNWNGIASIYWIWEKCK